MNNLTPELGDKTELKYNLEKNFGLLSMQRSCTEITLNRMSVSPGEKI